MGMFIATVLSALVAAAAAGITFLIYRANVDPHVIIYPMPNERNPQLLMLVIENIGKGVAENVRFAASRPIPRRAFGIEDGPLAPPMTDGPLIVGIPSLPPGGRRVLGWGQFGGLQRNIGDSPIKVTARFSSNAHIFMPGTEYSVDSLLEVRSFEGTDASDKDFDKIAADQLKKIADGVERLTRGHSKLRIEIESPEPT